MKGVAAIQSRSREGLTLTLSTVLDEALTAATDSEDPVVREVFRRAGLLWQCKNLGCRDDNPRGTRLCGGCGRLPNGRRIGDLVPPLLTRSEEFEELRTALREHFATTGETRPDAVTFDYSFDRKFAAHLATLHFGIRAETADFSDTAVAEVLEDLPHALPGEELRVALHHLTSEESSG